jgi:hypothetical protein
MPGKMKSLNNIIKNIYKVVDPWVNYYKHTDCAAGIEKIEQGFNEKMQKLYLNIYRNFILLQILLYKYQNVYMRRLIITKLEKIFLKNYSISHDSGKY